MIDKNLVKIGENLNWGFKKMKLLRVKNAQTCSRNAVKKIEKLKKTRTVDMKTSNFVTRKSMDNFSKTHIVSSFHNMGGVSRLSTFCCYELELNFLTKKVASRDTPPYVEKSRYYVRLDFFCEFFLVTKFEVFITRISFFCNFSIFFYAFQEQARAF